MKAFHHSPKWASTPPEVWREWQLRQLRRYLTHRVIPFSAHYRRVFADGGIDPRDLRTWDDWAQVPFTSKTDLTVPREEQREFVLIPDEATLRKEPAMWWKVLTQGRSGARDAADHEFRPVLLTSTTGRSSDPVPFLYTKHDLANLDKAGHRLMECGATQRDYRHMNLFPFAPHLAFWQAHHAGMAFGTFMLSTGGGKALGTDGNIALIEKIAPDVLIGMPTFIYHVLREAAESGHRWTNLKRLVLGGEKVAEGLRARLRELAGRLGSPEVSVMATYGFTEAKMAFCECPTAPGVGGSGYHLSPDLGLIELVDPTTGCPVSEGQGGEIVFTPLDARGTVVMRYRTGDVAEGGLTWSPCPYCGRTCPRLLGPISRVSEVREMRLDKLKGTLVNFNVLEHLLDDQRGIAAWQIELRKRNDDPLDVDEIHLHVTPEPGVSEDDITAMVRRRFLEVTELRPNVIDFQEIEELRRLIGIGQQLKEQKIIDNRPKASAPVRKANLATP